MSESIQRQFRMRQDHLAQTIIGELFPSHESPIPNHSKKYQIIYFLTSLLEGFSMQTQKYDDLKMGL